MSKSGFDMTDPFAAWREWLSESERQWNEVMNRAMATDEFSKGMGQFMETYVNYQRSMSEAMGRYFSALNLATRTDVISLAEHLTAIEEKLDLLSRQVAEETKEIESRAAADTASKPEPAPRRPSRTKRPPSKKSG